MPLPIQSVAPGVEEPALIIVTPIGRSSRAASFARRPASGRRTLLGKQQAQRVTSRLGPVPRPAFRKDVLGVDEQSPHAARSAPSSVVVRKSGSELMRKISLGLRDGALACGNECRWRCAGQSKKSVARRHTPADPAANWPNAGSACDIARRTAKARVRLDADLGTGRTIGPPEQL